LSLSFLLTSDSLCKLWFPLYMIFFCLPGVPLGLMAMLSSASFF
jgi:hypothetical protein